LLARPPCNCSGSHATKPPQRRSPRTRLSSSGKRPGRPPTHCSGEQGRLLFLGNRSRASAPFSFVLDCPLALIVAMVLEETRHEDTTELIRHVGPGRFLHSFKPGQRCGSASLYHTPSFKRGATLLSELLSSAELVTQRSFSTLSLGQDPRSCLRL
jgi:hypothetical protein